MVIEVRVEFIGFEVVFCWLQGYRGSTATVMRLFAIVYIFKRKM